MKKAAPYRGYSEGIDAEMAKKYAHYRYLRLHFTYDSTGQTTRVILQGNNGKKWVRAKARSAREQEQDRLRRENLPTLRLLEKSELEALRRWFSTYIVNLDRTHHRVIGINIS